MKHTNVRDGVIRVQGDKLCLMIGLPPGTKIPKEDLDVINNTSYGETITVCDKTITVSPSMKALVEILINKDAIRE